MDGDQSNIGAWRTLASLFTRAGLASGLGQMFSGKRKLYDVFGYNANPNHDDFWARFRRQDIAKRINDAYPEATWKGKPAFKNASEEFEKAFRDLNKDFRLWSTLERADKNAGLGQFAILVLGTSGGQAPEQPPQSGSGVELIYLQTYSEKNAKIHGYVTDPTGS